MGGCGCNEPNYLRWFPGPGDDVYVLEVHPGCPYCHTPVGITIYRLGPEEQEMAWGEEKGWEPPELGFFEISRFYSLSAVPILDPEILKRVALKYVDDDGARIVIEDALEDAHIDAVEGTVAAWEARGVKNANTI